jgi:cation:H+ antiporter
MDPLGWLWLQFLLCAALVGTAGYFLSRYGDVIAGKTGLARSWIGLVLLATVTSLPELVTGVTAVAVAGAPNIAVGDVFGSCVFNLAILIVVDLIHRGESVYRRASQGHILSGALGTVLIGLAGVSVLLGRRSEVFAIAHLGAYAPVLVLGYLIAVRLVSTYERAQLREFATDMPTVIPTSRSARPSRATRSPRPPWSPAGSRCRSSVRRLLRRPGGTSRSWARSS